MPDEISAELVVVGGRDWRYRGEGNANLVISLPIKNRKMVLRFAKSKYDDKDHDSRITEMAHFANDVMRPLLGENFVRPVKIGLVSRSDFELIRREVQPFRPLKRRKKDIKSRRVILSPDCVFLTDTWNTFGETLSIEIKPKQGWHSEKATCSVDLCHRCLKQYAKLFQGEIDSISEYCPLDLFSGDKLRMKRAILDLYESPHNRFKIFKDGDLIYTENTGDRRAVEDDLRKWFGLTKDDAFVVDYLSALIAASLLNESNGDYFVKLKTEQLPRVRSGKCNTAHTDLPPDCVLQKILSIQKHTDISDHEAKGLCEKLLNNMDNLEGLQRLVLWYDDARNEPYLSPSDAEDVRQLQRFLLSVTAKDVSLLLTYREIKDPFLENIRPFVKVGGKMFRLMISVIDLDPKPVHRITNWVERKEEWLKIYFDSVHK